VTAPHTVLVVDDDPHILRALRITLTARGYQVVTASTGTGALRAATDARPDVVLLDLGLPDLDGTQVISRLRGWSTVPVIVLSARTDAGDKIDALDRGADDYVTKPFRIDELLARLRAALRRTTGPPEPAPVVEAGELSIDLAAKVVHRAGAEVHLTPTEWGILDLLVRHRGSLVTRRQLLTAAWGPAEKKETSYLRVYLGQLRRKLEPEPSRPRHLITEAGLGYRFRT
jgi:two-component system KDP operon response regulator KdpE